VFFRKYGLFITYEVDSDGDLYMNIYTKTPSAEQSILEQVLLFTASLLLLIALMIYLTIKKFRRLNIQAGTYEKLRKLENNYEIEINPEMFTEMQALKVEINMLKNHSDEQVVVAFNALKQQRT